MGGYSTARCQTLSQEQDKTLKIRFPPATSPSRTQFPRSSFHFTPTSYSWADAVETFFATLTGWRVAAQPAQARPE